MKFPVTVAYNTAERKIGCPLVQAFFHADLINGAAPVDTDRWELNPSKCEVYQINNQEEFDNMIKITKGERKVVWIPLK